MRRSGGNGHEARLGRGGVGRYVAGMDAGQAKVVLSEHLDAGPAEWLSERARLIRQPHEPRAELLLSLADAEGLVVRTYTRVDRELLAAAPALQVVGRAGVGLDNIDLPACREAGVRVVYTPDANTQAVVEYVFALILDALRPRLDFDRGLSAEAFHEARQRCVGAQLDRLTLGVLGMGRIGRRVAEVARAIGIDVLANDLLSPGELGLSGVGESEGGASGGVRFVDKPTLYAESDIVTIHVDGRAANRGLIDAAALDRLKPTCLLINAARGMLVDNGALAAWADRVEASGGAAALDVHDPEPPPADYELLGRSNVRLLPHLASRTPEAMANMSWVVRDVVAVLEGRAPAYPAD